MIGNDIDARMQRSLALGVRELSAEEIRIARRVMAGTCLRVKGTPEDLRTVLEALDIKEIPDA